MAAFDWVLRSARCPACSEQTMIRAQPHIASSYDGGVHGRFSANIGSQDMIRVNGRSIVLRLQSATAHTMSRAGGHPGCYSLLLRTRAYTELTGLCADRGSQKRDKEQISRA